MQCSVPMLLLCVVIWSIKDRLRKHSSHSGVAAELSQGTRKYRELQQYGRIRTNRSWQRRQGSRRPVPRTATSWLADVGRPRDWPARLTQLWMSPVQ